MYTYAPFLRVTPPAGPQIVYDLAAIKRPDGTRALTLAQWIPEMIFTTKETVRRRLRNIKYGWRLRASFTWIVEPQGADEATLVEIGYYINRNNHTLDLCMSGLLTFGREVVPVGSGLTRTNFEDKNIAAVYHLDLATVDLLNEDSLPPEFVQSPPAIGSWHG